MKEDSAEHGGGRWGRWRRRLTRVPGLAPAYRSLRGVWRGVRAGLPVGSGAREKVSEVWGREAASRFSRPPKDWMESAEVCWEYVFPQFGGVDWYRYIVERCCPEARAVGLSVCCGSGFVEREFVKQGICEAIEGVDISPEAVEVCRREAESAGLSDRLTYRVADVERIELKPHSYDLVVAWMALHHLRRLEHVFREVRRALRPEGIFIINEYVGPARFQVPEERVAIINRILADVPESLRRTLDGEVKERFEPPQLSDIIRYDPSEAVRSDHIMPLLKQTFAVTDCIGYGGTILYWVLQGIVHNFKGDDPEHRAVLGRLYAAEREVLEGGRFGSDFAIAIALRPE